ncbi:alcohol dehydrogenase [Aspergillus nomiae NRRL 13137]|uniref:Alcohol dehydrogenase n=1 Tax=Aspergillus nomiae NRRL (strain ATCC 15546 / NRRL 13137 / CBS 260.88 / M93) TaxID=1509407 RepID=A0A0L1J3A5_ASPN3|nr:alcohol dehydrogenase [Aspergillus nomiae NRRL 13137]KNG86145.1 alcohol dehydrogenase [Aspergillus nomiae NRRL 13137]
MSVPKSYQAFRRSPGKEAGTIRATVEQVPPLHSQEVLMRVHAVSLNYRDVGMLHGKYPVSVKEEGIPASDCAGEVVAIGSAVTKVSVGDRVSPIFDLKFIDEPDPEDAVAQLGGNVDGVLRQYAVFDEKVLVRIPQHLSWEEAACITCAGTTAWNALGTGGVSMFALLICLGAGIHPIITSSSDKKLQTAAALGKEGTVDVINYNTTPDWEKEVLRLTKGQGVDIVLETVGGSSIEKSVKSVATRGLISWIGFLGGLELDKFVDALGSLFLKVGTLKAIQVGSKADQEGLCRFLEEKQISLKQIIGKTFEFKDAPAAFDYVYSGQQTGKVVIRI